MSKGSPVSAIPHLAFAVVGVGLAASRVNIINERSETALGEVLFPLVLASVMLYTGYRFVRLEPTNEQVVTTGMILAAGYLYGALFVTLIQWFQIRNGSTIVHGRHMILVAGIGGAAMATVIAHFYIEYTNRLSELRAESTRASHLQKQANVLNRILRHNIRNELTIIRGWLDIAADDAHVDADRGMDIVQDRLDKLESTSETARLIQRVLCKENRPSGIAEQVQIAIDGIQQRVSSVPISTSYPSGEHAEVSARLDVALDEILTNAVEHNDHGELAVDVVITSSEQVNGAQWWCIEISDNGSGIPPIEIDALNESGDDPLRHGQGLGLYLVQTIVEQVGGQLEIDAKDGTGTTVRLFVPESSSVRERRQLSTPDTATAAGSETTLRP